MPRRPSSRLLIALGILLAALAATFVDAARLAARDAPAARARAELAARLRVTDLVLFTEARYTRHPTQADLHSAFQDHPMSFEHFPSGSLLMPPAPPSPRPETGALPAAGSQP